MISSYGFLGFPIGSAMKMAPAGQIILKSTWTRGAVRETWPAKIGKSSSQRSQNANLVENEPPAGR